MEVSNNISSDYQIHDSPISTTELPELPRSSSILRERTSNSNSQSSVNNATSIQQTSTNTTNTVMTTTTNSSQQNEQQSQSQQQRVMYCDCGFESILREVKKDSRNRGRHFWSCSKFGGPDHVGRCNFFRWEPSSIFNDDDNDGMAESSSSAQNRLPYVLIGSANINIDNNNNNEETSDEEEEVNLTPNLNQLSENEGTGASISTPPTTPHRRTTRHSTGRASSPQPQLISPPIRDETDTTIVDVDTTAATRSLTGNVYTRSPAVFGNWDHVPKFTTPQLLDIVQNHLVKQDLNFQKWFTATQTAKKDLEKANKEVEKLKRDLDVISRENKLNKRENEVLKAEKRLLQHENDILKEENRELKRRRY